MLRVWLEYAWKQPRVCLEYAYTHLIRNPYAISVRARRTASPLPTDQESAPYGLLLTLLLLFSGVVGSWADDYEGFWYINNQRLPDGGYYFVPTINCFYGDDEDQPHLTTFKTGKDKNSIWRIEPVIDGTNTYYRIIHNATGKYLMANTAITALKNAGAAHRKRVHLETLSSFESDLTKDNSLFVFTEIDADNKIIAIKSKNIGSKTNGEGTDHLYLNPRGNGASEFDSYRAADGRAITNINGTVGFWGNDNSNKPSTSGQPGSCWKLETATSTCANPVIQYTDESTIQISYPIASDEDWTIYYTTDGSDPSDNANTNRTAITSTTSISTEGVTKVRAIATKENWENSDEAFLIASGKPQLIQSKECDAFYVVPPIVDGETNATTSNIPNAAMGWNFVPAGLYCGIQYYNIINSVTNTYLYCNGVNKGDKALSMKPGDEIISNEYNEIIDRAKFRLLVQADGSYLIVSKWWAAEKIDQNSQYYVNKKNGNNSTNELNLADGSNNNGQWNVIAASTNPKTQFDASFASSSSSIHFYQIQSATDNSYHVLPPASSGGNATANTTDVNPAWFFMPVDDNDTWIPYYHIRNGATGEYLYFNGTAGANNTLFTSTTIESGQEDRYKFIVVKSANPTYPNHYNIIPKALKDQANQENNSLNRNNITLRTQNSRNIPASNWKLAEVPLSCNNPVFNENDGSISISCVPDIIRVYYTTDGSTPNPNDENQRYTNNTSFSASDKLCIKAISTVSNESTSASSAVITLLNNPIVTLETGPYTYKGTAWEPSVTLSVGTTQTTTGFSTTYAYNTNAGTANVTITDNEASDAWYIWNVPVTEFTIDKAPLTIKANDKTIGYGDDPDNAGVTYTGFVGSPVQTESVLGGTLGYSYTTSGDDPHPYTPFDPQYGNQGSYVITPSGLTSTNYDITFSTGVLTVGKKSIGDGALAEGFTLSFDEDGNVILNFGTHTLNKDVDYTIGNEVVGTKYSTRTLSGAGNYDGSVDIRNAIVHFTTDANQTEWSATFLAESSGGTDIGHALPEDIAAYIISDIEGTWAIPEPLEYIPAGVPVLLVTHEEKNGFLVKDASNVTAITPEQIAYNKLKRVTAESAHFNTKEIYVLYKNEFVLNKEGNLENGKVYMDNPQYVAHSPSPAPANLRIAWGNSTGIETVHSEGLTVNDQSDRWYTLDGRCLIGKPTTKGLYIVNGKKIVIK
ncbi:MAG: chitobiase/beta-hexosaminidase C-terminal domain-containing protein [Prevotella sp.]|nr:chitobiase/beta-hexosaminidase C-terminal domain-containing protein [Prevotella sp.]